MFLGQSVPVVRTRKGYGLFCEVCALGHGPVVLHVSDSRRLKIRVDDPAGADVASEEE
jgi:hypothetical protein